MQEIMRRASRIVLNDTADGTLELRTEAKIIRYPDRYVDKRGTEVWNNVLKPAGTAPAPEDGERRWRSDCQTRSPSVIWPNGTPRSKLNSSAPSDRLRLPAVISVGAGSSAVRQPSWPTYAEKPRAAPRWWWHCASTGAPRFVTPRPATLPAAELAGLGVTRGRKQEALARLGRGRARQGGELTGPGGSR